MEVFAEQVRRPALERVKKHPGQRREYRWPAQQPEQRIDQAVFDVMHRSTGIIQMRLDKALHRQRRVGPFQGQVQALNLPRLAP
ncbi:hypothetical protein D3C75_1123260 [compost metagenome]